jgi:enoyl-CoA hydratase
VAPPGKPPVLDADVLASFEETVEAIDRDIREIREDAPRCVVLQSNSPKFFCVGANLNVLKTMTEDNFGNWFELGHRVFALLENLPVPVVAKVGGYALGGGLELAMAADVIVAGESARLGLTEARLGFVPGWGGIFRLAERVGPSRAKRMFFSSEMVDACAAIDVGLVDLQVEEHLLGKEVESVVVDVDIKPSIQADAALAKVGALTETTSSRPVSVSSRIIDSSSEPASPTKLGKLKRAYYVRKHAHGT